jgi:Family of unknown function (DUF5947)
MTRANGLRRFVTAEPALSLTFGTSKPRSTKPLGEVCEMCGVDITDEHPHVVNIEARSLQCTCRPCYLLFAPEGAGRGRYLAVPERYLIDADSDISEGQWEELQVPVGMAFFFENSVLGHVVAQYPSPAGATESLLDLVAWQQIVSGNRLAAALLPDVEALFVHRSRDGTKTFLVPIDVCYELVGRMRMHWTGFDGGAEARQDVEQFLERLRSRSRPLPAVESDSRPLKAESRAGHG